MCVESRRSLVLDALLRRLREKIREFLRRWLGKASLSPEIRRKVSVSILERFISRSHEVTERTRVASRAREHIGDTSHLDDLLRGTGGDDSRTARRRNEANVNGTTLAVNLGRHGVRLTELGTPETTADRDNVQLGEDHGTLNGVRDFLARLDAQADVAVTVADNDERL